MPELKTIIPTETQIANAMDRVFGKINQQHHLSQGFCLVNKDEEEEAWRSFNEQKNSGTLTQEEKTAYDDIHRIMKTRQGLSEYLDDNLLAAKYLGGSSLTPEESRKVANSSLKRRQLFIQYNQYKKLQAQLLDYAQAISVACHGEVKCAPGVFGGIKSFKGALNKITNRDRSKDVGDLRDVARITISFNNMNDLIMAQTIIKLTKEFDAVKHNQSAMKDRYCAGDDETFHIPTSTGEYRDIKFFLKMPCELIAELQLNTETMLVAKKKDHAMYDIIREAPDNYNGTHSFVVSGEDVLGGVIRKMNEDWFTFVGQSAPAAKTFLPIIKKMVERLQYNVGNGTYSLNVTVQEYEAMGRISIMIYESVGKGAPKGPGTSSTSIWQSLTNRFFR